jgi:hypothetical protein
LRTTFKSAILRENRQGGTGEEVGGLLVAMA